MLLLMLLLRMPLRLIRMMKASSSSASTIDEVIFFELIAAALSQIFDERVDFQTVCQVAGDVDDLGSTLNALHHFRDLTVNP